MAEPVPPLALALVLAGAFFHAAWNVLVRRGEHPEAFVWWLAASAAVAYAPLGLYLGLTSGIPAAGLPFVAATIAIHAIYFVTLGRAYARGDLSLVYPIARGTGPLLVPAFAVPFLGERLSPLGAAGIGAIVVGVVTLQSGGLGRRAWRTFAVTVASPASRYALFTGVTIALYSTVDKAGVGHVDPFLYGYLIFLGSAIVCAPYFWTRHRPAILACWRLNRRSLLVAGLLSPMSYFLALSAFRIGQVSYLAPVREVSIVLTAVLGAIVLGERLTRERLASVTLTAVGVVAIGLGS